MASFSDGQHRWCAGHHVGAVVPITVTELPRPKIRSLDDCGGLAE